MSAKQLLAVLIMAAFAGTAFAHKASDLSLIHI